MDKKTIIDILEQYLFVSDEWGGSKLALWRWGNNVVVDGIDDAADALFEHASQPASGFDRATGADKDEYWKRKLDEGGGIILF